MCSSDLYIFHQMDGAQTSYVSFLMNSHPQRTQTDLEDYVTRIQKLGPLIQELITLAQDQEDAGIRPPAFVLELALSAASNVVQGRPFDEQDTDSPLLADFRSKAEELKIDANEKAKLIASAENALRDQLKPAYQALITYLHAAAKRSDNLAGVWKLPDGDDYYHYRLQIGRAHV